MTTPHTLQQSHITLYTLTWIGLIGLVLGIKLLGATQDQMGYANMAFMAVSGLAIMGLNYYEGHRLMAYLKRHHPETWRDLTQVPGFGPGGTNSFHTFQFLNSPDDLHDPNVRWLKENYRRFLRFMRLVFIGYPVLAIGTIFF
jgi:hypothetical protein